MPAKGKHGTRKRKEFEPFEEPLPKIPRLNDSIDKWITVFGFSKDDAVTVLAYLMQFGQIDDYSFSKVGNWVHLRYSSVSHAQQVLAIQIILISDHLMVGVTKCTDKSVLTETPNQFDTSLTTYITNNVDLILNDNTVQTHEVVTDFPPFSSVYALVDSSELDTAHTAEERLDCVVGIGMTYLMQPGARLMYYRKKKPLMKNRKYKMVEVFQFSNTSVLPFGLNKGDTLFIIEYALHYLVSQFNEEFFTNPGTGKSGNSVFLNHRAIDVIKLHHWIKAYAHERLIAALESKNYVAEEICCPHCFEIDLNRGAAYNHIHSKADSTDTQCIILSALQIVSRPIVNAEITPKRKVPKAWCPRCGEGSTRADDLNRRHIGERRCFVLKCEDLLSEFLTSMPNFLNIASYQAKRLIKLLPSVYNLLTNDQKTLLANVNEPEDENVEESSDGESSKESDTDEEPQDV